MPPSTTRSSCSSTRLSSSARQHRGDGRPLVGGEALGQVGEPAGGVGEPHADDRGVEPGAQLGEQARRGTRRRHSTTRCSTRPVFGDQHDEQPGRCRAAPARRAARVERVSDGYCTTATCRVSCASSRTVRPTTSSRSTAPSRNVWIARRSARRQRLDRRQPVDEEPVALVGRDPPGAGVRLGDVALLLERRHVVADRGRRDAEVVPLDQRLGADRLLGGDVVLDDRAQHVELAVLEHRAPPSSDVSGRRRDGWHSRARVPSVRRRRARRAVRAPARPGPSRLAPWTGTAR